MQSSRLRSKTLYEILGVMPDASIEEIRSQYKELARLYHPDSNFYSDIVDTSLSSEQIELFKVITAAYQTLVDPAKRAEYDTSISPLINLNSNIPNWESRNDFWEGSKTVQTSGRQRKATFGHGVRSIHETQVVRKTPKSDPARTASFGRKPVAQGSLRTKILIFAICFSIGLAFGAFFLFKNSSTSPTGNSPMTAPSVEW